nr:ABC transporter ATP-binding protein [Desulfobacter latus]
MNQYLRAIIAFDLKKICISLVLTVALGLGQGIGLVMLVPLLTLLGLGKTGEPAGGISTAAVGIFEWVGLPFTLLSILCLYVVMVSLHAAATRYQAVLNTRITSGFTQALRNRMYRALCRADWTCFLEMKTSSVVHVMTSDLQKVGFATQQLLQLIGTVMISLVHIGVALLLSVPMTLFALVCGGIFLMILRPLNSRVGRFGHYLRDASDSLYAALTEHLGGMKVVKSLGLEPENIRRFETVTNDVTLQTVRFTAINTATRMWYQVGAATALSLFFYFAVTFGGMAATDLLIMIFLFARILPRFSTLQQHVQRIAHALPSFKGALEMEKQFQTHQEAVIPAGAKNLSLNHEICFSQVYFRYPQTNGAWTLENITCSLPAGKTTALIGPSGGGKSTLADLLLGLITPDRGSITIDGVPLQGPHIHQWRRTVGYVPQDTFLFHDTVRANLMWAMPEAEEADLWHALSQSAAEEMVKGLPDGLDTILGDRGVRLSGGERQRIALARALLRKPSCLILDEATSALDQDNQARIMDAVSRLHGRITILIIAHRQSTIQGADKMIALHNGKLLQKTRNLKSITPRLKTKGLEKAQK